MGAVDNRWISRWITCGKLIHILCTGYSLVDNLWITWRHVNDFFCTYYNIAYDTDLHSFHSSRFLLSLMCHFDTMDCIFMTLNLW